MIKRTILPALVALAVAPGAALAAGAKGETKDVAFSFEGPFGTYDKYQLQRGFQVYHEVCAACHGLKHLAIRELGRSDGPAFPEEQVKAIAALYEVPAEVGQPYTDSDGEKYDAAEPGDLRPAKPSDRFPANDAVGAPDLTLMAKARAGYSGPSGLLINQLFKGIGGPEYIYSILTSYTGETDEVAGNTLYENKAMPGGYLSMGPPLEDDLLEYEVFGEVDEEHGGHAYVPPPATTSQMAQDVSAFLMWAAEPQMVQRKEAGFRNLLMILLLAVLLYYTNKKLWAPIKRKT